MDAVERLECYVMLMCGIKKPLRWTIQMHISCMETLNKNLGLIPTIKYSPMVEASMWGNVPFNKATLASVILASLLLAWRNQYDLMHSTISKSPEPCYWLLRISRNPLSRNTTR